MKPGDTVYIDDVNRRGRRSGAEPYAATISKVGRAWAHLEGGGKVDLENLSYHEPRVGYYGRAWLSLDDWRAHEEASALWLELFRRFNGSLPPGMTTEKVRQVAAMIFGDDV